MNGPHSNDLNLPADGSRSLPNGSELLSAYYDGALTAEERAQVDQALAEDRGVRERLAEFSELSGLIRGAGTVSESELRRAGGSVLRDKILAQVSAGAAAGGASRTRVFSLSRWAIAAGALAATIMVVGLLTVPRAQPVAVNSNLETAPGGAVVTDTVAVETFAESSNGSRMSFSPAAEGLRTKEQSDAVSVARTGTPAEKSRSSGATVGAGVVRMVSPVTAAPESPAGRPMSGADPETLPSFAPGKEVDPGELISHLASVGGEAVLVQYTVIDVRRARGEMEVLLTRHGIRTLPTLEEAETKTRDLSGGEGEPQTVAIYVEAAGDQLMAALDEFKTVPTSVEAIEPKGFVKKGDRTARLSSRGQAEAEMPAAAPTGPTSPSDVPPPPAPAPARVPGPGSAPASSVPAVPPAPQAPAPISAAAPGQPPAPVATPARVADSPAVMSDSAVNSPAAPARMRGAGADRNERQMSYQVPLELSQKEAEQLWREVPKQQTAPTKLNQRYGDYVNQRRSFDAKDKLEAATPSRVLILLQEGPAPAAEKN